MKHPELHLFKIHKVFKIFSALQSENIETLVQEMLLLFTDVNQTGLGLLQVIQVSIDCITNELLHVPSSSTAILKDLLCMYSILYVSGFEKTTHFVVKINFNQVLIQSTVNALSVALCSFK